MSSKRVSRLASLLPLFAAALVLIAVYSSCKTTCSDPEGDDYEAIHSGTTDATRSVYESAPWRGKYLKFRPNKRYRFFHGLRGGYSLTGRSAEAYWAQALLGLMLPGTQIPLGVVTGRIETINGLDELRHVEATGE